MFKIDNKTVFFGALSSTWLIVFFLILATTVGETSLDISFKYKKIFRQFAPQGWGFFTRNPREKRTTIYKIEQDSLIGITKPNFTSLNLYGFSRKDRILQMDISKLLSTASKSKKGWTKCSNINALCDDYSTVCTDVNLKIINQGKYMLVSQKPIPWAWAKHVKKVNFYKLLAFEVEKNN